MLTSFRCELVAELGEGAANDALQERGWVGPGFEEWKQGLPKMLAAVSDNDLYPTLSPHLPRENGDSAMGIGPGSVSSVLPPNKYPL